MEETWFFEKHTPHAGLSLAVEKSLFDAQSGFQRVEVLQTAEFGRMLVLDNCVMLTDRDEFIYHEMIVHPALLCHGRAERVLIIGGGDGGSAREAVRHAGVEQVHLVEIDPMVPEVSRKFFPALSVGLDHPKVEVFVADGFDHLDHHPNSYDAVIVDSIDPVGEAAKLFTEAFYRKVKKALRPGGVLVCQTESPFYNGDVLRGVVERLSGIYAHTAPYLAHIPTYPSGLWSFAFASDAGHPLEAELDWNADFVPFLKYLTPDVFRAAFALPAYLQKQLGSPGGQ